MDSLPHSVRRHVYTLFLFTKSDLKTILFPVMLFACVSAPTLSFVSFFRAFIWTWLHLLQFCISNQSLSLDEDRKNKPWRPLPSRRTSVSYAFTLRWLLVPVCLALSIAYGVTAAGFIFTISIILHNELKLDSHWFTRNTLNALGYAVFDAGATAIIRTDGSLEFPPVVLTAHYLSIGIVLTTIHAQDFRDELGDREEKRRTIPIVMPLAGRLSMPFSLTIWSLGLCIRWSRSWMQSVILLGSGMFIGGRFYFLHSPEADRFSYLLYNLWLANARIMPIFS
ncbi:hypothetical protein A0H81_12354 [Grifola frondosa]|uniref:Digeranylgeranylglyceryl phosphate synthase n=1 Tax=Grifola frondosa TaxID=5627 RepID=A0A1C7LSP6_GRIFR|nr:hypothetical protein A0H81_12354 [Grifola frondosa]